MCGPIDGGIADLGAPECLLRGSWISLWKVSAGPPVVVGTAWRIRHDAFWRDVCATPTLGRIGSVRLWAASKFAIALLWEILLRV